MTDEKLTENKIETTQVIKEDSVEENRTKSYNFKVSNMFDYAKKSNDFELRFSLTRKPIPGEIGFAFRHRLVSKSHNMGNVDIIVEIPWSEPKIRVFIPDRVEEALSILSNEHALNFRTILKEAVPNPTESVALVFGHPANSVEIQIAHDPSDAEMTEIAHYLEAFLFDGRNPINYFGDDLRFHTYRISIFPLGVIHEIQIIQLRF